MRCKGKVIEGDGKVMECDEKREGKMIEGDGKVRECDGKREGKVM